MIKEYALDHIFWRFAKDPWVQNLFEAAGLQFDNLAQEIIDISRFDDFGRLPIQYIRFYENLLNIPIDEDKSIELRRSTIESKWKSTTPPTAEGIQAACNSWQEGECEVSFDSATASVVIKFISQFGVPSDLSDLQTAVRRVCPAHLGISYLFNFYLISDIHNEMTLAELETKTLDKFAR